MHWTGIIGNEQAKSPHHCREITQRRQPGQISCFGFHCLLHPRNFALLVGRANENNSITPLMLQLICNRRK
jgi:hypothetical protein